MTQISRHITLSIVALAAGIAVVDGDAAWREARAQQEVPGIDARVVAINIPGASAISQVGTFLNVPASPPVTCGNPIPKFFPSYIQPRAVLDPNRILVGSRSNFGAPLASGVGQEGSFLSIDPSGPDILSVPPDFADSDHPQASTLGGAVQMFSANSPPFLNNINNPNNTTTGIYTGVSNPLGLSNNNAFGRIWPANAPFFDAGIGSSSILDPNGLPLATPPNKAPNADKIGGVYVGKLTNRDVVTDPKQSQVIPGALNTGAVGTALLGPSPDGTCRAVFVVVTADGAIVQEHTAKGLDGLAPAGTVQSIVGRSWDDSPGNSPGVEPRFGVIMNPYTQGKVVRQLFVSEPFNNTIAIINLVNFGTAPNQVFGLGSVSRISSSSLNLPVDLAPVTRDADDVNWASNTTLDKGSDFYVANRGDNTIVRMSQKGREVRRVSVNNLDRDASLNGIATSPDGTTIYVTFTGQPSQRVGGVLALPAF
jgi:hypothetical protein